MRDTSGEASFETFGFAVYLLEVDGNEAPVGLVDLTKHMAVSGTNAIVVYEDPAIAIGRHLQSGTALDETLTQWQAAAQNYLAPCRKRGRRIALCQAPGDGAEADTLTEQLSRRFSKATLPELALTPPTPDAFFVALATIAAERDSAIRDLMEELQARSIEPLNTATKSVDSLAVLLSRWSEQRVLLGDQIKYMKDQLGTWVKSAETLTLERNTAREGEQTQAGTVALLKNQVSELQAALQAQTKEVTKLKADLSSQLEAYTKTIATYTAQVSTLTQERNAARSQIETLNSNNKTQVGDLNARIDAQRQRYNDLLREHTAALAQIETQTNAVTSLTQERDATQARIEALHSDHKMQIDQLTAQIETRTNAVTALTQERDATQARIEALHSDHKMQIDQLTAQIETRTNAVTALTQERDATQARIEALHSNHKMQIDQLTAQIETRTNAVTALTQERDATQARIEEFEQIETMLGKQVSELKQALVVTDASYRALETEKKNLQQIFGSEATDMEKILQDTRSMLDTVQGDWKNKLGARDTLRQHVRQFETALGMMEKRRAEAAIATQEMQKQLDAVYASTSWRVTAPIRSIKRLVRK